MLTRIPVLNRLISTTASVALLGAMVLTGIGAPGMAASASAALPAAQAAVPDTQSPKQCNPPVTLVNGGFEQPVIQANNYQLINDAQVPGWTVANSGNDHLVEMWSTGFNGTPSAEGKQFVELNANLPSTLYQDVATTPGQVLQWSLKHRGRSGTDVMDVLIGAPSGTLQSQTNSAGLSDGMAWGTHTGTYTVPAGQTTSRFAFKAISSSTGSPSYGNFLDDISFGTQPCVVTTKSVTNLNGRATAQAGDVLRYTVTASNNGGTPAKQLVLSDAIPAGTRYVPASLKIATGPGQGIYTDAAADDRAEFTANAVKFRLGNGATASTGGDLSPATTTSATFDVTVTAAATAIDILNVANVNYGSDWDALTKTAVSNTVATPAAPAADLAVTKKINTSPVVAGQPVSYTITASNKGPAAATGVTVVDQLPAGLANPAGTVNGQPCTVAGTALSCVVGNLANQASVDIAVTADVPATTDPGAVLNNTARISGNETDPVSTNNAASASATVSTSADLSIVKSYAPQPPVAGGPVTYTLTVKNDGPSEARNVTAVDTLDPEVTFTSASFGAKSCPPPTAQVLSCDLGTVPVGGEVVINVAVVIAPGAEAVVQNSAAVSSSTPDPNSANNASSVSFQPTMESDLAVTKTVAAPADPTNVAAGEPVTYTITVQNIGPSVAKNAVLTDSLPAGLVLDTVGGATCAQTPGGPEVRCEWDSLAVGQTATVTLKVKVDPDAPAGIIRNTATAVSAAYDVNTANNSASADITVVTSADLAVTKTAGISPIVPGFGNGMRYSIDVTNINGPSTALAVVVTDAIPAGMLNPTTSTGGCTIAGGILNCLIDGLAPDATSRITVTGTLDPAYSGAGITNAATVSSATPDATPGNNTSTITTPVKPNVDLAVTKKANSPDVTQGGVSNYVITVTNNGPSAAHDVVVTDAPGPGLTLRSGESDTGIYDNNDGSWSVGSLAVGESKELLVANNVVSSGTLPNTATAVTSTDEGAGNQGNNTATASVESAPAADVAITKTVSNPTPKQGENVTYTVTVTNNGPSDAAGVVATDKLPGGTTFATAVPSVGSYNSGTGGWTIGALANGATETLSLTVKVTGSGGITNTAAVSSDTVDPNTGNNSAVADVSSSPTADLGIVKTLTSGPLVAGAKAVYELTVTNKGPSAATHVVISDDVPAPLKSPVAGSETADCTVTGQQVDCRAATLTVGGTVTVTVTADIPSNAVGTDIANSASVRADENDPNASDNSSTANGTVTAATDVGIVKTLETAKPVAGQNVVYKLTVTNNGPSDAANVAVKDVLNSGLSIVSATTQQGSCTAGTTVDCELGTVVSGQTVVITLTAKLGNGVVVQTENTAVVTTTTSDTNAANDTSSIDFDPSAEADLVVTKTASKATVNAGDSFSYTVGVTNNGTSDAQSVVLTDPLPAGMTITAVDNNACVVNADKTRIDCSWATLADGASQNVTLDVLVDAAAVPGATTNTAVALSGTFDPDGENNSAQAPVEIVASADLGVVKTAASSAVPGKPLTFTVVVTNHGPSLARGVNITDMLPAELRNASSSTAGCTVAGQLVSCVAGNLAVDDTFTAEITAMVDPAFGGATVTNVASATSATTDPKPANNSGGVVVPVTPSADVSVTKTADKPAVNQGEEILYTITAHNAGPSDAVNVSVTDAAPAGIVLGAATTGVGSWDDATATWTIGRLAAGDTATLTVKAKVTGVGPLVNTVTATSGTSDPDEDNNTGSSTVTAAPSADLVVSKTAGAVSVNQGETVTYVVTVKNNGPSAAADAVVVEKPAAGVRIDSAVPSDGVWDADSGTWSVGAVANGAQETLTVTATMTGTGTLANAVSVSSPTHDPNADNNDASVDVAVAPSADLVVSKSAGAVSVNQGETVTYVVTVKNNGPSAAADAVVVEKPAAGVRIDSAVPSAGVWDADSGKWSVGAVANGAQETLTVTATMTGTGTLANAVSVSSPTHDPNPANNAASVDVATAPSADVAIVKTASPAVPVAGETVTYTLKVTNNGPSAAKNVVVTDPLAKGLAVKSVATDKGNCVSTSPVTCSIDSLDHGETATVTIVATLAPDLDGAELSNTATAASGTHDPDLTNNSSTVSVAPTALADVAVSKTASAKSVAVGGEVSYQLVVTNKGPATAKGVMVTDPLPAGMKAAATTTTAGSCSGDTAVVCSLGDLAPGASVRVDIKTAVSATATPGMTTNTAIATSPTPDLQPANNADSAQVLITGLADLGVSKTADKKTAALGETVTYTITVSNAGPSAALNPEVKDLLPKGLGFVSAKPSSGAFDPVTGSWTMPSLASDGSATLKVVAKVAAVGKIVNTATAGSDTPDPGAPNNTSSAEITGTQPVLPAPDKPETPPLSNTGAAVAGPLGAAMVLLLAGLVALRIRRRRAG